MLIQIIATNGAPAGVSALTPASPGCPTGSRPDAVHPRGPVVRELRPEQARETRNCHARAPGDHALGGTRAGIAHELAGAVAQVTANRHVLSILRRYTRRTMHLPQGMKMARQDIAPDADPDELTFPPQA